MSEKYSIRKLREFGILIGFSFPLLIGWFIPFITGHEFRFWTLIIGGIGFVFGFFSPRNLYYPYILWMKLGFILGWINSRIILSLVFLFVLIPISLIMKCFGHDPLNKKKIRKNSYRVSRKNQSIDLTRIF